MSTPEESVLAGNGLRRGPMVCAQCGKVLTADMGVEYAGWVNAFYCGPDCATGAYRAYMLSQPVQDVARLLELAGQDRHAAA